MEGIKRILVVSRLTQLCQEAVHQGISLARRYGASLYVIHVVHNPFGLEGWNLPGLSLQNDYENILNDAKEEIDEIIRQECEDDLNIKVLIEEGEPTKQILKVVEEKGIDLMVLLGHEEGRFEHFLFGRSNEELIRRMPCSLMLVKSEPKSVNWN